MKKLHLLSSLLLASSAFAVRAQTTAFTYQGHLDNSSAPAAGTYDVVFSLYGVLSGGSAIAGPVTNTITAKQGAFTTTLDFGSAPFSGAELFLQMSVRENPAPSGTLFSDLTPRQRLTSTPYAIRALSAASADSAATATTASTVSAGSVVNASLQNSSITGNKLADGQVVRSLNGLHDTLNLVAGPNITLGVGGSSITVGTTGWGLNGNSGTGDTNYLGTSDNHPLELRANNTRGLKLEYVSRVTSIGIFRSFERAMNTIGGYWGNSISNGVIGATIAGGGDESGLFFGPSVNPNTVGEDFGTVGGGYNNIAGGFASTVPGGHNNSANGNGSFAAGRRAHVTHNGSFMWGDGTQDANSTGDNRFEVLAKGGVNIWNGDAGINIDQLNGNTGSIRYGLRFGVESGEGIGSKRNSGGNLWGLDFYTAFENRMSIANNGNVGIGTAAPSQKLEVNGAFAVVNGAGGEQAYLGGDGAGSDVQIGSLNPGIQNVAVYNASSGNYMNLYVKSLTITGGADLAEPFEMSQKEIPQGSVVSIDEENPGQLKMSSEAYDSHVAGIVSGAGGINPGIQLKQQGVLEAGQNVALTGRVYVLADATKNSIRPGDLLTTSMIPGHAMKVTEHGRAQGAVIGKAMTGLKSGKGQVLVLVSLQ